MHQKFKPILIGLLFTILIIVNIIFQINLKNNIQLFIIIISFLILISQLTKRSAKISILFYILLGTLFYSNIFVISFYLIDLINPYDGLDTYNNGEKFRVMQTNWIWSVLLGIILSPWAIFQYNKIKPRYRILEISLTLVFILSTTILYIFY